MRLTPQLLRLLALLAPAGEGGAADDGGDPDAGGSSEAEGGGEKPTVTEAQLKKRITQAERQGGKAALEALAQELGCTLEEAKQFVAERRQADEERKGAEQREREAREAAERERDEARAEAAKARREGRFVTAATGKIRPEALSNGLAFGLAEFPADGEDDLEAAVAGVLERHPYLAAPEEPAKPNPPSTRGGSGRGGTAPAAQDAQVAAMLGGMGFRTADK